MFKTQKDHWEVGKSNKQTGTSYEKPSFVFYLIHRVHTSLSDLHVMTPIFLGGKVYGPHRITGSRSWLVTFHLKQTAQTTKRWF